jgi:hypothetical protein
MGQAPNDLPFLTNIFAAGPEDAASTLCAHLKKSLIRSRRESVSVVNVSLLEAASITRQICAKRQNNPAKNPIEFYLTAIGSRRGLTAAR